MPKELDKAFEPKKYEDGIYQRWEESGFFNPDICVEKGVTAPDAEPFTIVLPPPNVTGTLHMGHAAMLAIEDLMIRYHRMKGDRTLWLPGTDHAAVATESKVEGLLIKEEGMKKPKEELGREAFLERVKKFAQESHDTIVNQSKKMGSSLDWSREAYTLDETRSKAVRTVFKKMYDDGLIYRGYRVVNWSVKGQSTCSDDELVYVERPSKLYTFKYHKDFPISIATTRPETKVGDTAVAVHPDGHWKNYIGQTFEVKDIGQKGHNRTIKIIGDLGIDDDFGTGALGVTTAHSPIDFEMYLREKAAGNDIGLVQVIGEDGCMTSNAGPEYVGLTVEQAREKFVQYLRDNDLLEKEEETMQNVGTSDRFKDPVEPLPKTQWFIDVNKKVQTSDAKIAALNGNLSLKERMQVVVREGNIQILPERFDKTYFHWIDNLRDWCISRQIWFGHQVPVWYSYAQKKTTIVFVAHGESIDMEQGKMTGDNDSPLSEAGGKYAMQLKEQLKDLRVDVVISSDLERATDTARIVFGDTDADIIYDKRLRGSDSTTEAAVSSPSYKDVERLVAECLHDVQERFCGKTIAIVGHRGTERALEVLIKKNTSEKGYSEYDLTHITYCQENAPVGKNWVQDSDSLDTWFSAGLWTFSTLLDGNLRDDESFADWVKRSADFQTYHPTDVLETGYDILFFWVARMILMTTYTLGDVPFKTVYLHGLVRDEQGRKMSKSLGNIIDPLDMIEKYGTDATRLSLLLGSTPGNDMKLSEEKIEGFRNFTNKLWNISRFMLMNIPEPKKDIELPEVKTLSDSWILSLLNNLIGEITDDLTNYKFSIAGEKLTKFTWVHLADQYIENSKVEGDKSQILNYILNTVLKLWHPFVPYVTETIWQNIYENSILMIEKWPSKISSGVNIDNNLFAKFEMIEDIIYSMNRIRADKNLDKAVYLDAYIVSARFPDVIINNQDIIKKRARLSTLDKQDLQFGSEGVYSVMDGTGFMIWLKVNIDTEKEKARIEKEIATVEPYVKSLTAKLAGDFAKNAPEKIVEGEKQKLAETEEKLRKLQEQLSSLQK
jgi:valyl-tRNA synthetase